MRIFSILLGAALLAFMVEPSSAADADAGAGKFKQLCSTCHGPAGRGDGPAAAALKPKPRDMSDAKWQESVDDDRLRKVITDGGSAVGLSPTMMPFRHALKGDDLEDVVAYIRTLDD